MKQKRFGVKQILSLLFMIILVMTMPEVLESLNNNKGLLINYLSILFLLILNLPNLIDFTDKPKKKKKEKKE